MKPLLFFLHLPHFAAEVCARLDARLVGKPFVVVSSAAGRQRLVDVSPELRGRGLTRDMAVDRLPRNLKATAVTADLHALRRASEEVIVSLDRFSPRVACDLEGEYFLDMRGTENLMGPPLAVAEALVAMLKGDLGHEARVGIAATKLLARLAARVAPPGGACEVWDERFLHALPLSWLPGLGPVARASMQKEYGHRVLGDLLPYGEENLRLLWGSDGVRAHQAVTGRLVEDLVPYKFERRVEVTGALGSHDRDACRRVLDGMLVDGAVRLRGEGAFAHGFELTVTYGDGHAQATAKRFKIPSFHERTLRAEVRPVFDHALTRRVYPVKAHLVFCDLRPPVRQLSFMADTGREDRIARAFDAVRDRYGRSVLRIGFEVT